ncbi:MAG: hypothetical protein LBG91_02025 [Treponema sp.]|jgi:hypothetical protein|nr:hypothetical protein [Treponema sp.]
MITIRETEKARLLEYDGIQFWVQKKWQRADGTLTPAGKKSMAIAAEQRRRHADFDATKTFTVVSETAKAVLLGCEVDVPHDGRRVEARFWVPRTMITNFIFVSKKVREVENGFPFAGTKAVWPKRK